MCSETSVFISVVSADAKSERYPRALGPASESFLRIPQMVPSESSLAICLSDEEGVCVLIDLSIEADSSLLGHWPVFLKYAYAALPRAIPRIVCRRAKHHVALYFPVDT